MIALGGIGFSLWGLDLARPAPYRLKPMPHNSIIHFLPPARAKVARTPWRG
jgi:hypothetical protein